MCNNYFYNFIKLLLNFDIYDNYFYDGIIAFCSVRKTSVATPNQVVGIEGVELGSAEKVLMKYLVTVAFTC